MIVLVASQRCSVSPGVLLEKILSEDDKERLSMMHGLARALLENGQTSEALQHLLDILEIQNAMLPKHHPRRLATLYELGRAYREAGDANQSIDFLQELVRYRKMQHSQDQVNGPLLPSQHELALSLYAAGRLKEAQELGTLVHSVRQGLPREHSALIASQEFLYKFTSLDLKRTVEANVQEDDGESTPVRKRKRHGGSRKLPHSERGK